MSDPANQYVASFVGSPEMVFLEGNVAAKAGTLTFVDGPVKVPIRGLGGPGPLTVGFRPWDLNLYHDAREGGMPARVTAVERLGSSDQVFLDLAPALGVGTPSEGGSAEPTVSLRALARAYDYAVGDPVFVEVDAGRALFFDAQGNRLESVTAAPQPL